MKLLLFLVQITSFITSLKAFLVPRVDCVYPQVNCNNVCINTLNSTQNCGACGTICPNNDQCSRGFCITNVPVNQASTWNAGNVPNCTLVPQPGDKCEGIFEGYEYCTGPGKTTFVFCVNQIWQTGNCGSQVCGYDVAPWIKCYPSTSGGACGTSISTSVSSTTVVIVSTSTQVVSSQIVVSTSPSPQSTQIQSTQPVTSPITSPINSPTSIVSTSQPSITSNVPLTTLTSSTVSPIPTTTTLTKTSKSVKIVPLLISFLLAFM